MSEREHWLTKNVLLISFSAFFSDLGYQLVVALIPIYLILVLGAPAYVFGVFMSLSYGLGSLFAYFGGRLGDKYGKKRVSVLGNSLIPLMSLSGLPSTVVGSGILFTSGWWARNFRTPPRRALLIESSLREYASKVFGFLHALDIGGGMISVVLGVSLLALGQPLYRVILISIIPLIVATLLLVFVDERRVYTDSPNHVEAGRARSVDSTTRKRVFRVLLVSSMLFGLSSYSLGFPIITVSQTQHSYLYGAGTYGVFLGFSAAAGYIFGSRRLDEVKALSLLGYLLSALGTLWIGVNYVLHSGTLAFYAAVAVVGMGVGVTETYEPSLTSHLVDIAEESTGMGLLSAYRSLGLFIANTVMGVLFGVNQFYSYVFATLLAILACATLLVFTRKRV
ncbi:MAG: MFS transporter [Thermoprotei archaeon]